MQVYSELLPPTAVTQAVALSFLSSKSHNLVVAKTSLLQIFEVRSVKASPSQRQFQKKLVLVGEYSLAGSVTSLASIRALNTKSGGEALLIAVKDAKVSLVEWDPEVHSVSTISIHYYEGESVKTSPWAPDLNHCSSFLTVDPGNRCAALKYGPNHLAILPFKQLGDDLVADDYDSDFDEPRSQNQSVKATNNINGEEGQTPYAASFVLPLAALDPSLIHVLDLAFLYEYREPALGVLSSAKSPSAALNHERKDILSYTVFTLDIEQRARTPLLSVHGLPSDLWKLLPLPLPVGGTLLIGANELIHVDQSGKTNAVSVNEFAKRMSGFNMTDQSQLGLKLEHCTIAQLRRDSGDLLIILHTGAFVLLTFKVDGRSVAGLSLQKIPLDQGGNILQAAATCAVALGRDTLFIGSEDADSILISRESKRLQLSRKRSHAEMLDTDEEDMEKESEDEDDLYGEEDETILENGNAASMGDQAEQTYYSVHDKLINMTASGEPTMGRASKFNRLYPGQNEEAQSLDVVIPVGRGNSGALAILHKKARPNMMASLNISRAENIWTVSTSRENRMVETSGTDDQGIADSHHGECDSYLVTTCTDEDGNDGSAIYSLFDGNFEPILGSQFEADCLTVGMGVLSKGTKIVQISQNNLKIYDVDLNVEQVVPVVGEDAEKDIIIRHSSFEDPYVLLFRSDSTISIYMTNDSGKIEEVEQTSALQDTKWISGSLFNASVFGNSTFAFLLSTDGALQIFDLEDLSKPVYQAENLVSLPPVLSPGQAVRRIANRAILVELLATNLGDATVNSPHLIVRTDKDDVTVFRPFSYTASHTQKELDFDKLRWQKISTSVDSNTGLEQDPEESGTDNKSNRMRSVRNLNGFMTVLVSGSCPKMIIKEKTSLSKVFDLDFDDVKAMTSVSLPGCESGILIANSEGVSTIANLPHQIDYSTGWAVERILIGPTVNHVAYHSDTGLFVLSTVVESEFKLPEDDWHQEWAKEDISLRPVMYRGVIRLVRPDGWLTVNEFHLETDEIPLSLKILSLEISEVTHERKLLVTLGTGILRGEDLACNGKIYTFDIIHVVPEEGKPETNKKLKVLVQEEVRGSVTAISDIGNQGFLLAAQGQKCMVRGLKEDNSLLPIAFLDMQCYVSVLKNIKGTGLILAGDALRGIWLCGFSEEPCKMRLFSKSMADMEVLAAEFLPQDKQLHILAVDANCDVHVLEFNPEDPKSLSGQRLIQKSTFHLGHFPVSLTTLPSAAVFNSSPILNGDIEMNDADTEPQAPAASILVATQSGAMGLISPLDEQTYRRLGALQTYLNNVLEHCGGLNPRAYRAVESEGFGSKGILDGQVLSRWAGLGSQRRSEACARVGASEWQIRNDLGLIAGAGLHYL